MASNATLDRLCAEFDSPPDHLAAVIALLEDHATPAYIARYRRAELGNIGEERLTELAGRLHVLTDLEQRKAHILQQAEERGRRTPELEAALAETFDQDIIDDYYQALRPRRRGVAMQMEEKGLLPLALAIQHRHLGTTTEADGATRPATLLEVAAAYVNEQHGVATPEAALEGALLILADRIAHDPRTRARFRDELRRGVLRARPADPARAASDGDSGARYREFFDFAEPIARIPPGRMLALRRAEREGILVLELTLPEERHRELLRELHAADLPAGSVLAEFYDLVADAAAQQLQDVCGKDVRRRLKERADREAVRTFARNLRSQLLAPPLGAKKVLVLRSSSKLIWAVLLGEDGSVAQHRTLPIDTDEQKAGALELLQQWIRGEQPAAIAVPHGRRQAGSERLVGELRSALGETPLPMVVAVDEAASAIFATSQAGKKLMPGVDVGARAAISLGRRLQDPLLELIRMDARTLGIGQSLDDVHQGMLQRELAATKSSCLAQVGCDLNTAPQDILEQLPGLRAEQAEALVAHRRQHGGFKSREDLRTVPGIDAGAFRNAAGFVRIVGGTEPLDATPIHPEDYPLVAAIAAARGVETMALFGQNLREVDVDALVAPGCPRAHVIGVLQQLQRGCGDVRGELIAARNDGLHSFADLHTDRELHGRVTNLTEFGAFVDLGIGHDGLVHVSQIPGHRLRDAQQMLRVGEVVKVWVLHVDQQQHKIALSMHKPRHLQEGRLPTLGERLEQQQGRRRPGPRPPAVEERKPGASVGRLGGRRGPPEARDDGGGPRFGRGRPRPAGGPTRNDRRPERGTGRGGAQEQRIYTVEPAREVAETRTHKGEVTSLAGLRALLGRATDAAPGPAPPVVEPGPEAPRDA